MSHAREHGAVSCGDYNGCLAGKGVESVSYHGGPGCRVAVSRSVVVISADRGYLAVGNGKITPVGAYNPDAQAAGDTATRAAVIGDNLYTISGEKAVAFSIKDCSVLSSVKIK